MIYWSNLMTIPEANENAHSPALVTAHHREAYLVLSGGKEFPAKVSGKLVHAARSPEDFPTVGDRVLVSQAGTGRLTIEKILPRTTILARKAAGEKIHRQIMAANIDTVFITTALDGDFNLRRIERMISAIKEGGARAVVLMTKKDLVPQEKLKTSSAEAATLGADVPFFAVNGETGDGIEPVRAFFREGTISCFIGVSGAGKSTLVNRLMGREIMKTGAVRGYDKRGRHTTTSRQMFFLPDGAAIIDTPGIREFGLVQDSAGIEASFADLDELALRCKFTDCRHDTEPGCAVRSAAERGEVEPARVDSYRKLQKETLRQELKTNSVMRHIFDRKARMTQQKAEASVQAKKDRQKNGE